MAKKIQAPDFARKGLARDSAGTRGRGGRPGRKKGENTAAAPRPPETPQRKLEADLDAAEGDPGSLCGDPEDTAEGEELVRVSRRGIGAGGPAYPALWLYVTDRISERPPLPRREGPFARRLGPAHQTLLS